MELLALRQAIKPGDEFIPSKDRTEGHHIACHLPGWKLVVRDYTWHCDLCDKDIKPGTEFLANKDGTEGHHLKCEAKAHPYVPEVGCEVIEQFRRDYGLQAREA